MNRFFKTRLPALLLTLVMVIGMVPAAAAAAKADLTFKVYYDEEVKLSRAKFVNLLEDKTDDDDLGYMEITKVSSDFDDYGYFTAKDVDGKKVEITKASDLKTYYFYDAEYFDDLAGDEDVDFLLDGLTFCAHDDAEDGTVTVEFTVKNYDEDEEYDGVLEIEVTGNDDDDGKDKDDFDEDDYDLVYKVDIDDEVEISRSKLASLFKSKTKETLYFGSVTYVDSDFTDYGWFEGYYDGESFELETAAELKKPDFYYAASDVKKFGDEDVDFELNKFKFVSDEDADDGWFTFEFTMWDDLEEEKYVASIAIVVGEGDVADNTSDFDEDDYDLVYELEVDDEAELKRKDFNDLFHKKVSKDETMYYMEITSIDANFNDYGYFAATDAEDEDVDLKKASDVKGSLFFYTSTDAEDYGEDKCYLLNGLTFVSHDDAEEGYFTVKFTLWDDVEKDSHKGTMAIVVGDPDAEDDEDEDDDTITADLTYSVDPKKSVELKRKDFKNLFEDKYDDFSYVTFTKITNLDDNGYFTATDYYDEDVEFETAKSLKKINFFYDSDALASDETDYELAGLKFTADKSADGEVVMVEFTMYGDTNNKKSMKGILLIQIGDVVTSAPGSSSDDSSAQANIRKSITSNSALQLNVNDITRAFKAKYPGGKVQYVKLMNVPATGALYYDYYNTSGRTQLTATNIGTMMFYPEAYGNQIDLGKLTYIPSGSNYCTAIVFVAYGNVGQQVVGSINIGVTTNAVSEVYGVTPKNTSVSFPASAIYSAVQAATGKALASIKLMELPASTKGSITGNLAMAANTSTSYTYATSNASMSQLKFNPGYNYTGSVEIPYMAYDASGNAIAMGTFSLGVVNSVKKFTDITSSTWCYKYITELSDASVIGGYADGSFKPNATITYGAALKLVTLAAGHGEKAPIAGGHTFSGYLAYAQQKGWVTGNVNLSGNITRLQIAQLAAKAMGLSVTNLSSTRPFTDTADVYVQALNAAGIIEGYFSNGSYAYRPTNTLTRGQVSAIVWRMRNYKG